jgi:hypothetical protein
VARHSFADDNLTSFAVEDKVASHLGNNNSNFSAECVVTAGALAYFNQTASRKTYLAFLEYRDATAGSHYIGPILASSASAVFRFLLLHSEKLFHG